MRKKLLILVVAVLALPAMAQKNKPAIPRDEAMEANIENLLAKMTLDDKVGQMLELNLDVMGSMMPKNPKVDRNKVRNVLSQVGRSEKEINDFLKKSDKKIMDAMSKYPVDIYEHNGPMVWKLNETMLDTLIAKYRVGSILNAPGTRAATIPQWQEWIGLIQKKSMKYLGIPDIYGLDNNHGVTYVQGVRCSRNLSTSLLLSTLHWPPRWRR